MNLKRGLETLPSDQGISGDLLSSVEATITGEGQLSARELSVEGALISSIVFHPQGPQSYLWLAGGAQCGSRGCAVSHSRALVTLPTDAMQPEAQSGRRRYAPAPSCRWHRRPVLDEGVERRKGSNMVYRPNGLLIASIEHGDPVV